MVEYNFKMNISSTSWIGKWYIQFAVIYLQFTYSFYVTCKMASLNFSQLNLDSDSYKVVLIILMILDVQVCSLLPLYIKDIYLLGLV